MSIGIGILGCGMITQVRHAPEYARDPRATIVLVWDADPARAREAADRWGAQVAPTPEALWSSPLVHAVSVCSPNHLHASQSIAALQAGKAVLCEKPMASSLAEAQSMVDAARTSGQVLMVGHNQRFVPAHRLGRELIAQGALGRVLSFHSSLRHGGPEKWGVNKTANTWFFDKARAHYGVLGDLGTHKIDLVRFLTGQEVVAVHGWIGTVDKKKADGTPIDLEDEASVRLRLASGLVGTVDVSWCHYGSVNNETVVTGEKGVLTLRPEAGEVVLETSDGRTQRHSFGGNWVPGSQDSGVIDEFLSALTDHRAPLVTGEDGHRTLEVVEAALASAASGSWVEVSHG